MLERSALPNKSFQVEGVGVLEHHVDLGRRLVRLVVPDAVVALQHAVYLHLDQDLFEFCAFKALQIEDLAGKDLLGLIHGRADSLPVGFRFLRID